MGLITRLLLRISGRADDAVTRIRSEEIYKVREEAQKWIDRYLLTKDPDDFGYASGLLKMAKMLDYNNEFIIKIVEDKKLRKTEIIIERNEKK